MRGPDPEDDDVCSEQEHCSQQFVGLFLLNVVLGVIILIIIRMQTRDYINYLQNKKGVKTCRRGDSNGL